VLAFDLLDRVAQTFRSAILTLELWLSLLRQDALNFAEPPAKI